MKKNIITVAELVTLLSLLLAPMSLLLIDSQLLFPYITSKNFAWRTIIEVALVGWAALALLDTRYRINIKNPVFVSFSLFMIMILIANTLGIDPFRSFWSNAERMDGYIGLLHMFAFFLAGYGFFKHQLTVPSVVPAIGWCFMMLCTIAATYNSSFVQAIGESAPVALLLTILLMAATMAPAFDRPTITKTFIHGLLSIGVWLGVIAIFQDKGRADSVLGNPIYLASFSSFSLFASAYYVLGRDYLFSKKWAKELLYGSLILFFLWIIFETATRGAVLGLLFGGLTAATLMSILAREKEDVWWRRLSIAMVVGIVTLTVLFFSFKDTIATNDNLPNGHLIKRAANFSLEDKTTKHRLANWEQAIDGFRERPFFGWGQENYIHVFSKYYQADKLYDAEQWFDRTHNMFLDWLVFGGLFGLGSFLLLLATMIVVVWQKTVSLSVPQKSILTGIVIAYVAQNFVAFDALATGIWITTFMIVIALLYPDRTGLQEPVRMREEVAYFAIVGLIAAMLIWMSYSIWQPKETVYRFMSIIQTAPGANQSEVLDEKYQDLVAVMKEENLFTQEYIEQLLNRHTLYINSQIEPVVQKNYAQIIAVTTEEMVERHPHVTRFALFYASFLQKTGNFDRAHTYLEKAYETSPNKIQILWLLGQNAAARGENQLAIEYMQQAADLAPEYSVAQESLERVKNDLGN